MAFRNRVVSDENLDHSLVQRLECLGSHVDRLGLEIVVGSGIDLAEDLGIRTVAVVGMEVGVRETGSDSVIAEAAVGFADLDVMTAKCISTDISHKNRKWHRRAAFAC